MIEDITNNTKITAATIPIATFTLLFSTFLPVSIKTLLIYLYSYTITPTFANNNPVYSYTEYIL